MIFCKQGNHKPHLADTPHMKIHGSIILISVSRTSTLRSAVDASSHPHPARSSKDVRERKSENVLSENFYAMDNKSLNCTVFFNPIDGEKNGKSKSNKVKEQRKTVEAERLSSPGNRFSIKYVPEQFHNSPIKIVAHSGRSDTSEKKGVSFSGSSIEIEEFISPYTNSSGGLQMHYVIDDKARCETCLEMKYALDCTFQKLYRKAFNLEESAEQCKEGELKVPSVTKQKNELKRSQYFGETQSKFCTTPIIKEVEETGPLIKFFSRLIRTATIDNMKNFLKDVERKLTKFEMYGDKRNTMPKAIMKSHEIQTKKDDFIKSSKTATACDSCQRLQEAVYATVSKIYEEAGIQTDFPTVQTLETYAFLVFPNDVQKFSDCKRKNSNKKRRHVGCASKGRTGTRKDFPTKAWKMGGDKKTVEELVYEENKNKLQSRIRRHKAIFTASKYVHIIVALVVSFLTIILILTNWITEKQSYTKYVKFVIIVLFFGCVYNTYLIIYHKTCSFKNYFSIPICWVLLAFSNGKCEVPMRPYNVCDPNIHFMSHVYLFIVFLEYYVASGIHAVVVLEINQFQKISIKELLKYSAFNLPLMIIVLGYTAFRMILKLRNLKKTQPSDIFSKSQSTKTERMF